MKSLRDHNVIYKGAINIMEEQYLLGIHQHTLNQVFKLKNAPEHDVQDYPLIMQNGDKLYEQKINREVYSELEDVSEILRFAGSIIYKHRMRNHTTQFLERLFEMAEIISTASSKFYGVMENIDEDCKKKHDRDYFMTLEEWEESVRDGDADQQYDDRRQREI